MSVLYLLTSPDPVIEGTDAVFQEVTTLQNAFGGVAVNLFPRRKPGSRFPRALYGFHQIGTILRLENQSALSHLFFPVLHFFPILHLLKKPVVYTIAASLDGDKPPRGIRKLKALHRIVVSNERDAKVLRSWEIRNYSIIPPGIDRPQIAANHLPVNGNFTLLMASAPWVPEQFDLKGIDALLETVARLPYLKLILLWRGLLLPELLQRVKRLGIANRIEIVNRRVQVGHYLDRAHATVLLAKRSDIVKAFPHSLIESLLAGKPVILSDAIPMADYVRQHRCGLVLDGVNADLLTGAIESMKINYADFTEHAKLIPPDAFSIQSMLDRHRELYGL